MIQDMLIICLLLQFYAEPWSIITLFSKTKELWNKIVSNCELSACTSLELYLMIL